MSLCIFFAGSDPTYEELGAVELLKSNGYSLNAVVPPNMSLETVFRFKSVLARFGLEVKVYTPGLFDQTPLIVSFGRPELFELIEKFSDKPRKVVYGLLGDDVSKNEVKYHKLGFIDEVFSGSRREGLAAVQALVKKSNRGVEFRNGYVPFCNPSSDYFGAGYVKQRPACFRTMRNTPDDAGFAFPDHWLMAAQITVPASRAKSFTALNWGKKLSSVAGNPGDSGNFWHNQIDAVIEAPAVSWGLEKETYYNSSAAIYFYPKQEVFSFSAVKAMLLGTVVVAHPSAVFLDLISHGETGFLAKTPDEAAYYVSRLAWEPFLRTKIAHSAYSWAISEGPGNPDKCLPWWRGLIDV
jgi:glycosyltransferase involved in cell wall biosynthesis